MNGPAGPGGRPCYAGRVLVGLALWRFEMFRRFGFGVAAGLLAGAIGAFGCDTQDDAPTEVAIGDAEAAFDEAFCERLTECGCDPDTTNTESECRNSVETRIAELRAAGEDLIYDPACFGAMIDALDDRGCGQDPEPDDDDDEPDACERPCFPFHGAKELGESCVEIGYDAMSDCAQGLRCQYTDCEDEFECTPECVDPCARAGEGQSCRDTQCRAGLECDYGIDSCVEPPGAGDGCRDTVSCAEGTTCNWDAGVCVALPKAGESCLFGSCAEDAFCEIDPVDPTIQTCRADRKSVV